MSHLRKCLAIALFQLKFKTGERAKKTFHIERNVKKMRKKEKTQHTPKRNVPASRSKSTGAPQPNSELTLEAARINRNSLVFTAVLSFLAVIAAAIIPNYDRLPYIANNSHEIMWAEREESALITLRENLELIEENQNKVSAFIEEAEERPDLKLRFDELSNFTKSKLEKLVPKYSEAIKQKQFSKAKIKREKINKVVDYYNNECKKISEELDDIYNNNPHIPRTKPPGHLIPLDHVSDNLESPTKTEIINDSAS